MTRYYLTHRPPAPGAFPGKPVNLQSFDDRKYVEEIGRPAWGWVEYEEPLTEKQAADYELVEAAKRTISIELNTRELKFLAEFAEKQHDGAKDNVGTRTPIHVVERKEEYFSQGDGDDWMCEDNEYEIYGSFDDMLEDLRKNGMELPPYDDVEYEDVNDIWISDEEAYCKAYGIHAQRGSIIETYRPVAFFLIRDEAVRYKDGYQKHNCDKCRIYTYGLGYSNDGDLPVFRELLMKIGKQLLQEGEGHE